MKINLTYSETFESRHNGPDATQVQEMLHTIGADSVDTLISQTIPDSYPLKKETEHALCQKLKHQFLKDFKKLAQQE